MVLQITERDIVDTLNPCFCDPTVAPPSRFCPLEMVCHIILLRIRRKSVIFYVLEKIAYALGLDNSPSLIFVGRHVQNAAMRCRHLTAAPMLCTAHEQGGWIKMTKTEVRECKDDLHSWVSTRSSNRGADKNIMVSARISSINEKSVMVGE